MNKNLKFLTVSLAAFVIGFSVNNFAMSDVPSNFKVAVVDVPLVVSSSTQVKNLKKEQEAKTQELVKYVENARKNIAASSDEKKKKDLEAKYSKELQARKEKMEKEYVAKLSAIDASISKTVNAQAKAGGYNLVLAKNVVLHGGEDITQAVIKAVK